MSTENQIKAKINTDLPSSSQDGISASNHRGVHEEIANNLTYELDTLTEVGLYGGSATKVIVRDSQNGGVWVYTTSALTPSSPNIISASGKGSGVWIKVGHVSSQIPLLNNGTIPNSYLDLVAIANAFAGIALPSDDPGVVSIPTFWLAAGAGTYTNFGGLVVSDDVAWIAWNGVSWELYEFTVNVYGTPQVVQVGGDKTLALSDGSSILNVTDESIITIPTNAAVSFQVNSVINFERITSNDVLVQASNGVMLNGVDGGAKNIDTQYGGAYIRQYEVDKWIIIGNIS